MFYNKYINNNFDNQIIHTEILDKIKNIITTKNIPNIILYSHYSSCKSILLNYILYLIYGKDSLKKKNESIIFSIYNNSVTHTINYERNSNYIIYTFLGKLSYDKYILNELTKLFIESYNIKQYISDQTYRIIIIKNAEYLSIQAQSFLRRIMEKYSHICKFFFLCNQICPIILPIQSRCLKFRVPNISELDIVKCITMIIDNENIKLSKYKINKLIKLSNNNLYESILSLQKSITNNKIENIKKIEYSYKKKISEIINKLFTENINVNYFENVRDILYKILILNINDIYVILELKNQLFEQLNNRIKNKNNLFNIKLELINIINEIQIKLNNGNKSIFYLELIFVEIYLLLKKHKLINEIES